MRCRRCAASSGSTAVPSDFAHLLAAQVHPAVAEDLRGTGSPALISIAGQMTQWKL